MSEELSTLNHNNLISAREESQGDTTQLSVGVWQGNAAFTVWANGKPSARFPINGVTTAILKEVLKAILSGETKVDRFPITQRKYNQDTRSYDPQAQLAIVVDKDNERPRLVIELAANKERFRFPISIPKSYDIEGCEFSKRQMVDISCNILLDVLNTEIPTAKRLSSFPRKKNGGGNSNWGNKSSGGSSYGGSSKRDDDDIENLPF